MQRNTYKSSNQFGLLIKAHGCISDENNSTLVSTIKLLAETKNGFINFPEWKQFLLNTFKNKILLVLGYSGSDDFDIMPLIRESQHKVCYWVNYKEHYEEPVLKNEIEPEFAKKLEGINRCYFFEGKYNKIYKILGLRKLKNQEVFLLGMVEGMIGIKIKLQKSVSQCQDIEKLKKAWQNIFSKN